jgi:hypothetical protein
MRTFAGLSVAAILLVPAACGGGSSSYVAKVGSEPITKKQLRAVLDLAQTPRYHGLNFPRPGSAEYLLVRQQALRFLVQQTRAHLADAKLGIKPEDRLVTHSSFLKVTAAVHVTEGEIRAYFVRHRKRYQRGTPRALDVGVADQIRNELKEKRQEAAMHHFLSDARRRWPVTYAPGFAPVSEMALARRIWPRPSRRRCDLPTGTYLYGKARAHGCLGEEAALTPGVDFPVCTLIDFPGLDSGFTSAEMDDGYAEFVMDNGGECVDDPRLETVPVQSPPRPQPRHPVKVSYLHLRGSATFKDARFGYALRYPRRLHFRRLDSGIEIANYPLARVPEDRPLSAGALDLFFIQGVRRGWSTPPPRPPPARDSRFPIRIPDSALVSGSYDRAVWAHALQFSLTIRVGSALSAQDRAAIRAIAASIRFAPLRAGSVTPSGYYVLARASRYPVGSVTQVEAGIPLPREGRGTRVHFSDRFYLEHTADGFRTITWPHDSARGYKGCGVRFEPSRRRFTCRNGAVWNLDGQVVRNPDPARFADDPLYRESAPLLRRLRPRPSAATLTSPVRASKPTNGETDTAGVPPPPP